MSEGPFLCDAGHIALRLQYWNTEKDMYTKSTVHVWLGIYYSEAFVLNILLVVADLEDDGLLEQFEYR